MNDLYASLVFTMIRYGPNKILDAHFIIILSLMFYFYPVIGLCQGIALLSLLDDLSEIFS